MNPHTNGKPPDEMPPVVEPPLPEEAAVGAFLRRWRAPAPDPAARAALLTTLLAELPPVTPRQPPNTRVRAVWAWQILRAQARLVHPATWAASGLVIVLGALVTLLLDTRTGAEAILVIVAPVVTACGVAFLYGGEADPVLELQLATPVSPRLILLARLALLFGLDLTITLACSIGLKLVHADLSLTPLIAAWLAPMTFLSALAFLLSVLFFDPLASVLLTLLLWAGATLRHFVTLEHFPLPDLLHVSFYPAMLVAAPALVLVALWLSEREERWTGGAH